MEGLRRAIQYYMPIAWETVLRKHKIYTQYIEYVYKSLPDYMKGKKIYCNQIGWRIGLRRVQYMFKNWKIYDCIQGQYLNAFKIKVDWKFLDIEIFEYYQKYK